MPKHCVVFVCHGNYPGEPYTCAVSYPKNEEDRSRWIDTMPNG